METNSYEGFHCIGRTTSSEEKINVHNLRAATGSQKLGIVSHMALLKRRVVIVEINIIKN